MLQSVALKNTGELGQTEMLFYKVMLGEQVVKYFCSVQFLFNTSKHKMGLFKFF